MLGFTVNYQCWALQSIFNVGLYSQLSLLGFTVKPIKYQCWSIAAPPHQCSNNTQIHSHQISMNSRDKRIQWWTTEQISLFFQGSRCVVFCCAQDYLLTFVINTINRYFYIIMSSLQSNAELSVVSSWHWL